MEDDLDLKELSIILGLKNDSDQLNILSLNKKKQSFIGAISDILYSDNINELYDNIDSQVSSNQMIDNFMKNSEIKGIGPVKLELYKDSNFIDNIKGDNNILSKPQIDFSEVYISKLQKDFIKEEQVVMEPIEIKKTEDNKKYYRNKNTKKRQDGNNKKKINNAESKEIEQNTENKNDEDEKDLKNENDNFIDNNQNDGYEEKEEKEGNNNKGYNYQNNRRPYNKKYNKNKGHKEFRQNLNSRKMKNYK